MGSKDLTLLAVGDLVLYHDDPKSLFSSVAAVLKSGDVVVGQVEVPYTLRGVPTFARSGFGHMPNPANNPKDISALVYAGFNVITLAGNHVWDSGVPGIEDTIAEMRKAGIVTVGTGMNIDEARRPAIVEKKGARIGFLDYNCVGPEIAYANSIKPGCAYVHIVTAYEVNEPCPGASPIIYTFAEPRSLQAMVDDIHKLRSDCDVLVVKFHKGLGFVPVKLAMYEQQVSHVAIDTGADLVLAEHAHILKGIEQYNGKTIFHGLGNFVSNFQAFPKDLMQDIRRAVKELYNIESDSDDPSKHYHPEAMHTIIAKCSVSDGRISKMGYVPCSFNEQNQPEILKHDERGQQVFDYVADISRKAGLSARFEWDGDEVVIY